MTAPVHIGGDLAMYVPNTREGMRRFLAEVLPRLHAYDPMTIPAWPGAIPVEALERMARDNEPAGDWLEDFVRWRVQVQELEDANVGRLQVLLGALVYAKRLEAWDAAETLLRRLVTLWRLQGEPPMDLAAIRAIAPKLCRNYRALPARLRSHAWRNPVAAPGFRGGRAL